MHPNAERNRLAADAGRLANWKRWGPYLSERQWATVREDYSEGGTAWEYFPHDQARSRAYRWGEDGLLGITDRQCRLCFALALWNGRDPILKERLFGLAGPEGNHGEDVKECYFYLDSTPTHSYLKALYKYPQAEFPYARLVEENRRRGKRDPEFELTDTGVFDEDRYFDVFAEYAKADPDDILIRITVANRGRRGGDTAPAADALVPQHLDLGLSTRGVLDQAAHAGAGGLDGPSRACHLRHPRLRRRAGSGRRAALLALHRERNQHPKALRSGHLDAIRQGCVPRLPGPRPPRRRESRPGRHQGRRPLPAGDPGERRRDRPAPPHGAAHGFGRRCGGGVRPRVPGPAPRGGRVLCGPAAAGHDGRGAGHRAAGVCRAPVEQAVLSLHRPRLARGGSAAAPAAPGAGRRPQCGLAPPVQPRRHLDARQVGVSVVRRLGPGVPHDPVRGDRPRLRQATARALPARMVHAPQRADARLRVQLRRREPARARLGLLARLQDDRRPGRARSLVPIPLLPEAADQLHLVGQSQGPRRPNTCSPAASSGSTTSACSIAPSRCRRAASWNRPTAPPGWPFFCATMLSMALELARDNPATRTWPPSSSSTSSPSPTP